MKKHFLTAWVVCACSASAFAQGGGGMQMQPGISSEMKRAYETVKNNLIGAAITMPATIYSFAPVPEEMTFSKWVAHVADAQTAVCSALTGQPARGGPATKTS